MERAPDWPSVSVAGVVARIPMMHSRILVMLRRVGRVLLRLRTGRGHARRFRVVTTGASGPQRLRAVVKVIWRGSLDYQVQDGGASHYLDGSFERKIGEPLSVAPNDHVAGFQARCFGRSVVSGTLNKFPSIKQHRGSPVPPSVDRSIVGLMFTWTVRPGTRPRQTPQPKRPFSPTRIRILTSLLGTAPKPVSLYWSCCCCCCTMCQVTGSFGLLQES